MSMSIKDTAQQIEALQTLLDSHLFFGMHGISRCDLESAVAGLKRQKLLMEAKDSEKIRIEVFRKERETAIKEVTYHEATSFAHYGDISVYMFDGKPHNTLFVCDSLEIINFGEL